MAITLTAAEFTTRLHSAHFRITTLVHHGSRVGRDYGPPSTGHPLAVEGSRHVNLRPGSPGGEPGALDAYLGQAQTTESRRSV